MAFALRRLIATRHQWLCLSRYCGRLEKRRAFDYQICSADQWKTSHLAFCLQPLTQKNNPIFLLVEPSTCLEQDTFGIEAESISQFINNDHLSGSVAVVILGETSAPFVTSHKTNFLCFLHTFRKVRDGLSFFFRRVHWQARDQ